MQRSRKLDQRGRPEADDEAGDQSDQTEVEWEAEASEEEDAAITWEVDGAPEKTNAGPLDPKALDHEYREGVNSRRARATLREARRAGMMNVLNVNWLRMAAPQCLARRRAAPSTERRGYIAVVTPSGILSPSDVRVH